ncbi:hypothetical protein LINPERPRIM_LOCUS31892, partial [Linum perenne]
QQLLQQQQQKEDEHAPPIRGGVNASGGDLRETTHARCLSLRENRRSGERERKRKSAFAVFDIGSRERV